MEQRFSVEKGWQERGQLGELCPWDPVLARAGQEAGRGCLFREKTGGFSLAFPWAPHRPFPLVPAFCFCRVREMWGGCYLLFRFRWDGRPYLPAGERPCQNGETGVQYQKTEDMGETDGLFSCNGRQAGPAEDE